MAAITRLGHVGIAVRDLDRSVRFYDEMLGIRLTERFDYGEDDAGHGVSVVAGAFSRVDSTHHCISFFVLRDQNDDLNSGNEGPPSRLGLHHIAFELPTPESLLSLYRKLKEAGVPIVNARRGGPGNQPRFYARDPDGNLLEFYWGIDSIGWDGIARPYDPIDEIDLEQFDFDEYLARRESDARGAGMADAPAALSRNESK